MVRIHVMQPGFIKRSGIIAVSFLIATLTMVIMNVPSASALLNIELPLGKNLVPITDRVNGLVNKSLGLPVTINSTGKVKVDALKLINAEVKTPIVPAVVDTVTQPLNGTVNGLSDTLRPVTDDAAPAVRGALSRTFGNGGTPPARPQTTTPPSTINPDSDVAGVATRTSSAQPKSNTELTLPQQTTFFSGVTSFFASTMPAALQDIARNIAGKEVGFAPIIISLLLFLMTIGTVGGIVYVSNHGGALSLGRHKFTLFAHGNDQTEMATFIVVAICFGVIAMFLALTSL